MSFLKPDPPPTPDYAALAQQQGAANLEAAIASARLNHPNQVTPYGTRNWTVDPNDPLQWTVTDNLSPEEQTRLEMQRAIQFGLMNMAGTQGLSNLEKVLGTNFTPPREAQLGWEPDYAPDQRLQTESGFYELPWIQEMLDLSGVAGIPEANMDVRNRAEQALYSMADRYMAPQFERDQAALDTKLSNQGIFAGSEAHAASQGEFNDAKTKAYADLIDRSIAGGGDEMARQFGLDLQRHQVGVGDELTKGNFANASRGQAAQELWNDMQARNAAIMGQVNMATGQQAGSNTGTQAWIAQKAQGATTPVNILTALMSGGQVQNPQWQPFSANASYEAAPLYQAGRDTYQAGINNTNFQQAGIQNMLNLGGKIAGGFGFGG